MGENSHNIFRMCIFFNIYEEKVISTVIFLVTKSHKSARAYVAVISLEDITEETWMTLEVHEATEARQRRPGTEKPV